MGLAKVRLTLAVVLPGAVGTVGEVAQVPLLALAAEEVLAHHLPAR